MNREKQRLALAVGLVALIAALGLGILAIVPGLLPQFGAGNPNRLATLLSQTIDANGIDAAAERYRTLHAQGFRGVVESEADTNTLGYALLGRGQVAAAIRIFQLNVETHPNSANVYDSLGEAYLAAGNRALAVANYEEALSRDPKSKSAAAALEALTGRKRPPYRPLVLFHILMGLVAIASGAIAIMLRKGSRSHNLVGRLFGISMLSTSGVASYIAFTDPQGKVVNVVMGLVTFYLVATAWRSAYRRRPQSDVLDWVGMAAAAVLAVALVRIGLDVAAGRLLRAGAPSGVFFVFATIAALAAALDLRMIRRGGLTGTPRLTRHLWRMCTGLFVAVGSFFLGQPQVFPVGIRNSGLLVVPPLVVVFALGYWLLRVQVLRAWPHPLIRLWPALRRTS